jgi:chorismate synthase
MLRWLTAGESHGPELIAVLEGLPAGVPVTTSDIQDALARRRLGYGRGARMKFEKDEVTLWWHSSRSLYGWASCH